MMGLQWRDLRRPAGFACSLFTLASKPCRSDTVSLRRLPVSKRLNRADCQRDTKASADGRAPPLGSETEFGPTLELFQQLWCDSDQLLNEFDKSEVKLAAAGSNSASSRRIWPTLERVRPI